MESFPAPSAKFDELDSSNWQKNTGGAAASPITEKELHSEHLQKPATRRDKELDELLKTIPAESNDVLWSLITAHVDEMYCVAERVVSPIRACLEAEVKRLQDQGEQVELIFAPLKSPVRVFEKAVKDYRGVSARVLDVIRCRIVCSQLSGLLGVLAAIDGVQGMRVLRRKNKFHPKALMPSHFRNILMSVQVPTLVVPLQALLCPSFANCLKYLKV